MKNCIVYGNCHIFEIRKYLMSSRDFSETYSMIDIPPVYLCDKETGLDEESKRALGSCDLFIYQKVSPAYSLYLSTDYLMQWLPESCKRISFANSYFTGYHPQFAPDRIDPYADRNIIRLIHEGKSNAEIAACLSDESFYSAQEVKANLDGTLNELTRRDREVDIPVADFIERHYKDEWLFYTVNHPAPSVIRHLAIAILAKLGMKAEQISGISLDSMFTRQIHPIYPSVIQYLNLTFIDREDSRFTMNSGPLSFAEYIDRHANILRARLNQGN
jgi:hypothetical protein